MSFLKLITVWVCFLSLLCSAIADEKLVPFKASPPQQSPDIPAREQPNCSFDNLKLPAGTVIMGSGAYSGYGVNKQIDQSGHEATRFDVIVNSKKPVALILAAYEPTIWNIGWSKKTNIVAVLVSGYHRQVIAGLQESTPTLISTYDNKGECGYFYFAQEEIAKVNAMSEKVYGRPTDFAYAAKDGLVTMGDPVTEEDNIVTSNWKTVDSYFDSKQPLAGKPGLDAALAAKVIRLATKEDLDKLEKALGKEKSADKEVSKSKTKMIGFEPKSKQRRSVGIGDTYVVLKKFTYPAGLFGAHAVTFMIPKGVPTPDGNSGHSLVYDLNKSPICTGPLCRIF